MTAYLIAVDQQLYANHFYLLGILTFLLTLGNHEKLRRRGIPRTENRLLVDAWPIFLMNIQMSIFYFFGAISKLNPEFLSGKLLAINLRREGWLAIPDSLLSGTVMSTISVARIVLELYLALGFWFPST